MRPSPTTSRPHRASACSQPTRSGGAQCTSYPVRTDAGPVPYRYARFVWSRTGARKETNKRALECGMGHAARCSLVVGMLHVVCCTLYGMLHVVCCMLYAVCYVACMLHVVCCIAACCVSHVVWYVACCMLVRRMTCMLYVVWYVACCNFAHCVLCCLLHCVLYVVSCTGLGVVLYHICALQADQAVHIPHRCDQLRRRPRSLLAEGHAASRVRAPLQHSLHLVCACCMPTASCEHCAFACCMLFDCTSECCTARTYSQPRLPTVKSLTVQKHCQLLALSGISVLVLLTQEWLQRVVVCCNVFVSGLL